VEQGRRRGARQGVRRHRPHPLARGILPLRHRLARGCAPAMRKARPQRAPAARKEAARTPAAKLLRIAGLPAVSALFATSPERVERLFFDDRMKPLTGAFCMTLARARKPYRVVPPDELERVAGTVLHGV